MNVNVSVFDHCHFGCCEDGRVVSTTMLSYRRRVIRKLEMGWHWIADGGNARGRNPLEVTCIVDWFPAVIFSP